MHHIARLGGAAFAPLCHLQGTASAAAAVHRCVAATSRLGFTPVRCGSSMTHADTAAAHASVSSVPGHQHHQHTADAYHSKHVRHAHALASAQHHGPFDAFETSHTHHELRHGVHVRHAHLFANGHQSGGGGPPLDLFSAGSSLEDERGRDAKWLISQLLQHFNQTSEVRQYIKYFGSAGDDKFAIIRVSGDVLHDRVLLDSTASALAFLHRVGLRPIVVHGAGVFTGRQANHIKALSEDRAANAALEYMESANAWLVEALHRRGVEAAPLTETVFSAVVDNNAQSPVAWAKDAAGLIKSVNMGVISRSIRRGQLPVVASMGWGLDCGRMLTFSTSAATAALAKEIQPLKVIMLRPEGHVRDSVGERISRVVLSQDYERLCTPGSTGSLCPSDKADLTEAMRLFSVLKPGTTIAVTSPDKLTEELFTHRGAGTLIMRGEKVTRIESLADDRVDVGKLTGLLEASFRAELPADYFKKLDKKLWAIYISETHRGVAIVTREHGSVPYLDKFSVMPSAQGDRLGELVWQALCDGEKELFWRSRADNPVNAWYYERADGAYKSPKWTVFWRGLQDDAIMPCVKEALAIKPTFNYSAPPTPAPTPVAMQAAILK